MMTKDTNCGDMAAMSGVLKPISGGPGLMS